MVKELNISELTTEQKLGMTMTAHVYQQSTEAESEENLEYALNMIRKHALGAIWVDSRYRLEEVMSRIREAADYPIRIVSVIQALQVTNRVSTVVHFGNPFVLEELEHIPRILIGGCSLDSICCTLDVLAGNYPAKGHLPYELTLN